MSTKKKGLGRGLDALLGTTTATMESGSQLREIAIELIHPNPFQPRTRFDDEALTTLADSIRAQGVIQPVVLRRRSGEYELIAGERRWRAAQLAGLDRIPAVIREIDDTQAAAMALIENLQREDLDAIEQAEAMRRLVDDFQLTHQQVADALGVSRPVVSNALRLLDLTVPVRELLQARQLEPGHARALAGLPKELQQQVAEKIVSRSLTVRQVEDMIRRLRQSEKTEAPPADPDSERMARRLSEQLGVAVQIRSGRQGRGQMTLKFDNLEQLDRLLVVLGYSQ